MSDKPLNLQEQIARIDRMQADLARIQEEIVRSAPDRLRIGVETDRKRQEMSLAPWKAAISGMAAGAALFGAGFALAHFYH